MRAALDKLRSVLVALTCDQHSSAALLREALADLERHDAAARSSGADDAHAAVLGASPLAGFGLAQFRDDLVEHVPDPSPPARD